MDMNQTLLFSLLFVLLAGPVWMHHCFDANKLEDVVLEKLRSHYYVHPAAAEQGSPASCPVDLYQFATGDISNRSLSPWRQVKVTNMEHFPHTYMEAECLCSGCIIFKDGKAVESHDYNSTPINQSKVFFQREPCKDGKRYRLKPFSKNVAVGCTCVRPSVQ